MKNIKPIALEERISSIDILRGFALFGILLVNVLGFNASFFNFGGFYNNLPDDFQKHFYNIYISLTADKFIFLFSFLFGYGIFIQYNHFKMRGEKFVLFFSRRMLVLFCFGMLHIFLLWAGDILLLYAIAGMVLLLFHRFPSKLLLPIGIFFYFFIGIWLTLATKIHLPDALSSTCTDCLQKAKDVYAHGNYFECMKLRLQEYSDFRNINAFYYFPKIIGITIFGFIASRNNLHEKVAAHKWRWTIVLLITSIIGAVAYFGYEKIVDFTSAYANAVYMTGYEFMNVFIAGSYLLFILLISSNNKIAKAVKPVASMGKMSLTNYLSQSLFLSIIFYGWGFGYFGQTKVTSLVLLASAVYILQLVLNFFWFRFYKQGPLEKLWRRLSYGKSL